MRLKDIRKIITTKFFLFSCILACFLLIAGCKKNIPYDYDEAVAKLNQYCGSFPTSFGIIDDDSVFIYDVTGDGIEDLCTFVSFGSGMPRTDIVLFDVENDEFYTLDALDFRGAYGYDYTIVSVEEYGVVISERQFYPKECAAKYGLLTFEDGKLGMDEFENHKY